MATYYGDDASNTFNGMNEGDFADGLGGNDTLYGGGGDDQIIGGLGDDALSGDEGDDTLNGGAGADTLWGGAGSDTYIVVDRLDTILEDAEGGTDTVTTTVNNYFLPDEIENLNLRGTAQIGIGNARNNAMTGNAIGNRLDGREGSDFIFGENGDDTLNGGDGNDTLDGAAHNDVLNGGDGDDSLSGGNDKDTLNGGAGADTLIGGYGDDTYTVADRLDTILEYYWEAGGTDTVNTTVNNYFLPEHVENLNVLGGALIGIGNTLNNAINGNALNNRLDGREGADTLKGGDGNDTLNGNDGRDELTGGAGADTLAGGAGVDIYFVSDRLDTIIEAADGGFDQVATTVNNYFLPDGVEDLVLLGGAQIGIGNALNNTLRGNSLNNRLDGGDGNDSIQGAGGADTLNGGNGQDTLQGSTGMDILTGGAGYDSLMGDEPYYGQYHDRFVFTSAPSPGYEYDYILDFAHNIDWLVFKGADYGFSAGHVLTAAQFTVIDRFDGAAVGTSAQFIWYDRAPIYSDYQGQLFWDPDGTGPAERVRLAMIDYIGIASVTKEDLHFT